MRKLKNLKQTESAIITSDGLDFHRCASRIETQESSQRAEELSIQLFPPSGPPWKISEFA